MSRTLLLADDSATMQRVVELTFAEQGVQVVSVSDGQEAIDYISSQQPSLALVSATLPKLNGFEVARFVRDHAESRVPVLLLAGAFDNLDDARVRESGASGVIVKPFEPAVVIKRVKELLGMKPELPQPPLQHAATDSAPSHLVTNNDAAKRDSPARSGIELASTTPAMAETAPPNTDYLAQLGAAFDSLDAQLAARSAPADRATNPPSSSPPTALDPPRIGAPPSSATGVAATSTATEGGDAAKPVFEVDDNWFEKKPVAAESLGELTEFIVTRASDFASPTPATTSLADRSWLPPAARAETQPVNTAPEPPRTDDAPSDAPGGVGPESLFASAIAPVISGVTAEAAVGGQATKHAAAPDAPPALPGAPRHAASSTLVDLSERSIDALTSQLTERVAARVGAPLAERLSRDLASRMTNDLADRVVDAVAERVAARLETRLSDEVVARAMNDLAPRVSEEVGARVISELTARLSTTLTQSLTSSLGDRLSTGLAEDVAERAVGGALGDSLRQTVHEVAERVVRAEVERIKAAAESLRS